jgi:hypothetical protein
MRELRVLVFALLVCTLGAVAAPAVAGTHPQNHDGWSIGFGFGGGSGTLNLDGTNGDSEGKGGGVGSFRVGFPLNEKISLAFEGSGWARTEDDVTLALSTSTFGVAYFPAEGLALRGGIGFGSVSSSVDAGSVTVSSSESGLGLFGAVGYDFRLARTFALGPQVDLGYVDFDGGSANWIGLSLQFNWYFVPKP